MQELRAQIVELYLKRERRVAKRLFSFMRPDCRRDTLHPRKFLYFQCWHFGFSLDM